MSPPIEYWRNGPCALKASYLLHVVKRKLVEDTLRARGEAAHTKNRNVTLQADYRVRPRATLFARTQPTSKLFFNDIPVTYNSSTAERFGSKYSLVGVGLRADLQPRIPLQKTCPSGGRRRFEWLHLQAGKQREMGHVACQ